MKRHLTLPDFSGVVHSATKIITDLDNSPFTKTLTGLLTGDVTYYIRVAASNSRGVSPFCAKTGVLCDTTTLALEATE